MLLLGAGPLLAGTVTTTADSGAGSLRNVVAAGGTVTFGVTGTITLTTGPITIPTGTTITGPAANQVTVSGNNSSRIFAVLAGSTVNVSGLTLTAANAGAGGRGGAINNLGSLALDGMVFNANNAGDAGGAIYNAGSLTVRTSTLSGNAVTDAGCAGGGAIRSETAGSTLVISNSTITSNTANACSGGGVSFNEGTASITSSTISANSAGESGGNLYKGSASAALTLTASVIGGGVTGGGTPVNPDVHGAFGGGLTSGGRNLVQARGDGIGYVASDLADGTNPLLGALANNGGATPTRLPQLASPLLEQSGTPCTATDQRGFTRPQGNNCDIGAVEYRQFPLTVNVNGSGSVSAGATPVPTIGSISNCTGTCIAYYDGELQPTVTLTATPNANQMFSGWTGACVGGSNPVTTVAMTSARTCVATFVPATFVVTPSVGTGNGAISPSTPQTVNSGATTSFTLTPAANYHITGVGGTCGGNLAGNTYTTNAIVANCTVVANFAIDTHMVTPSVSGGNGTINPSVPVAVNHGSTTSFTLAPNANYHVASVGGTCGGNLAGNVYTTNAIVADCTVIASFAIDTRTVTPSVNGGNGAIAPSTPQTVNHGATTSFTLTPNANYHVGSVTGTCGGNLAGNVYTTNAVNADCTVIANFAIDTHTVTPSVTGGNGAIAPSTPQTVNHGATTSFTLTPAANYHVGSVTGTCGGNLAGNVYTTNAIVADCTVIASFAIDTHTVTPSVNGGNGAIAPSTPQTVNHGATTSFTLTPAANYHIGTVTGTCGGNLAGNVYTTNAVTADCTVIASFAIDTHVVTPSVNGANGAIAPSTPQTVNHGATTSFTLTPAANYHIGTVTGTCGGNLAGNVYTTNAVTADCSVIASFTIDTHTVTPSVNGGNGAIAPSTPQTVNHGATTSFTLTPAANYHIGTVTGTCGGNLAGNVYTTNAVTADCTVVASFAIDTHVVTPSVNGGNGAIAPSTPQTVDHGATTSFTLTPAANYHVGSVTGTCGGNLAGNVYTTNAVTADCTVIASFAIDTHMVTPSVGTGNGTISPSTPQSIDHGATTTFTLTPASSYHIVGVAGTCGGNLAGNAYTTNAVTADCTVVANFAIDTHTIGGSVSGLVGSGLALRLNGANDLPIAANGPFVFTQPLDDLSAYAVTVSQQPTGPTQVCTVANGSGTLAGADVTNVAVTCAPPVPHLVVSVTDNRDYVRYGMLLTYLVRVTNDGEGMATGVSVANTSPPQIDTVSTSWACHGAGGGAVCQASGSGALNDTGVALPPGRTLTWVVTAPVRVDAPTGLIDYTVNVGGPSPASATDHDTIVIFRTGMDVPYGDGAETGAADDSTLACAPAADEVQHFDLGTTRMFELPHTPPTAAVETVLVARGEAATGFRIDRLNIDATPSIRLVAVDRNGAERATAWAPTRAGASLALGIATTGDHSVLLLEGAQLSLELALPDGVSPAIVAQTSPRTCGE
ncbi:uncharacterized protein YejL (UPF0352 family) [Dokdonella fugitiva]|uniref:Uncharacterized protein YejL (UPF0352 family) n=1 Tax=Dokdonella fugitiva TaxID=328517 RepID=A0A839EWZ7_9GAMM|nr:choice-of-anchor Q domain-containing protein [Dokdonella fugitiva]MBA8886906.1 uncharacterized protein YejL (UPF0352 family) [Dokdonella fugitiva]